jgi:tyrosine-protein phosphatase SIW14
MTTAIRQTFILFLLALSLAGYAAAQTSKDLPNFYKVNADLYRGGQPSEAGIKQLASMGIKTIVDLRDNDERSKTEEEWAASAGIRFISIPLGNWFGPKDADVARVAAAIDDKSDQPVFVHCKRGSDRTGTMIAVYRISHEGWTGERAAAEAGKFGMGWWQIWMKDYINDYYRDYLKGHRSK